jgi:HEAT repeat protein
MQRLAIPAALILVFTPMVSVSAQTKKPAPKATPAPAKAEPAGDPVSAMLKSRALAGAYNPVLLAFLLEEGRPKLPPEMHKQAVDQLVERFKAEIDVRPAAQATAALASLAGLLAPGAVGAGIAEGAGSVWASWVDAAVLLARAGYIDETIPFLENCLKTNPYPSLQARCASALTAANPGRALEILMGLMKDQPSEEVVNSTLRLLGDVAGTEGCPQDQKDAAVQELIKRTQGMMNSSYNVAAIDGLVSSKDARAVEPIRKMTGGMRTDEVKRAAKRALLLGFKDSAVVESLKKDMKGGLMKNEQDKFVAGTLLIEAGHDAGFAWAQEQLTKKKGGFFKSDDQTDSTPDIVSALVTYGGAKAVPVLQAAIQKGKPAEWLTAFMAIGLLELGDKSAIEIARSALNNTGWTHTRLRAAEALAKHGDLSGVVVLKAMAADPNFLKKATDVATGRSIDHGALREAIAGSLGRMNHADCVPLLTALLDDKSADVRTAAAFALARITDAAALDALPKALDADYGKDGARARTPEVRAHLVRTAAARFPKDPRTTGLLQKAAQSELATVRFLALVASRG